MTSTELDNLARIGKLKLPKQAVALWCRSHGVRRLSRFGSVLRDDFRPESDVDVLVEFEPGARVGLLGLAGMEIELSRLLGRRAVIHTVKGLNPRFRDRVLRDAEIQYEQA